LHKYSNFYNYNKPIFSKLKTSIFKKNMINKYWN
jgi:hypothetical protein